jgi:fatty acid synthase
MSSGGVAISGISGRFPQCHSFEQFAQSLFNQTDLVTELPERFGPRTSNQFDEIPKRSGKVLDWHKFDAKFFGLSAQLADRIDPQVRKLCEVTYEAIVDAGQL